MRTLGGEETQVPSSLSCLRVQGMGHPVLLSIPLYSLFHQLVPKNKRRIQPRKRSTMVAPRRPSEAKEQGPKKPSEAKKDPLNPGEVKKGPRKPGEVRTVPSKPGAAKGKAPKKGSQTKDQEARLGTARKAPGQPDRATQAPPSTSRPGGESKVKGRRNNQGRCVSGVRGRYRDTVFWQPLDVR